MNKKKHIKNIVFASFIVCVVLIGVINVFCLHNTEFWNTSVASCMTLLVALIVSYYFSKKNQDERNQKDTYLKIMEKIQNIINEEYMIKISNSEDVNRVLMKKRELNNSVRILKAYSKKFNLEKEIVFIDEKIQEYANFFGNHQGDIPHLRKSELDLKRPLELMDCKIQEAMIKLYE